MCAKWEYLKWSEGDRKAILKVFDRTPETVKDDIAAIREWMKKQPHLDKYKFSKFNFKIKN